MSAPAIPMLDLAEQYRPLQEELLQVLRTALDSGAFIMGGAVRDFEAAVARHIGVRHAIACASGSDALLLALMALRIGPGDAVVTTPYSFFATVSSITRLGAHPLLVDIEPDTFNIDPAAVRRLLETECEHTADGPRHRATATRIRVLLPVHLFGQCADMTALAALAQEWGLRVVEDAAQALGARWDGHAAGRLGDIGCFSFYPAKNLGALGDGGLLTTEDDDLAEMLRKLRVHGAKPKYIHQFVGVNSRLDAIQAGFLQVMLPHLPEWEAARRMHAEAYGEALAVCRGVQLPAVRPGAHHVFNQFVIRSRQRDALRDLLTSRGVSTEVYYPLPLHQQECFHGLGYAADAFPESNRAANESLALPVGPTLSPSQQSRIVDAIRELES